MGLKLSELPVPLRTRKTFEDAIGGTSGTGTWDVFARDTGEKIGEVWDSGRARWTFNHRGRTYAKGWSAKPSRIEALWSLAEQEWAHRERAKRDERSTGIVAAVAD